MLIVIWKLNKSWEKRWKSMGMPTYLWDLVTLRAPRSCIEPCSSLLPSEKDEFRPFHDFLAKIIEMLLERNWRDSWKIWAREIIELTLEMVNQLPSFIFHPCIERSRVRVERWFQKLREIYWAHQDRDGDGELDLHLVLKTDVDLVFLLFFSFSSSLLSHLFSL